MNLLRCGSGWLAALAGISLLFPDLLQGAVTEAWVHRYSNIVSNSVDQAFKVVSDTAGDVIVAGTSDNGSTGKNMLTIKYSGTDGSVLWQKRYHGPDKLEDRISGLALDGNGNVVVLAISAMFGEWGPGTGEYYTAKYAAADGAILWEKRRPKGSFSFNSNLPALVAVHRGGDVVVSMPGLANPDGSGNAYITKYAAESGTLLWEKRYESPFHGYDWLNSLAVDANGNVFAAGRSDIADSASEYYVAKYSADGDILWERHSVDADGSDPFSPRPVAVDNNGDLVVISRLQNETKYSIETRKYSGRDGTVLWTRHYEGPSAGYNSPVAVGLDSIGNVIVTGSNYLAKYAAANGGLLWENLDPKTISATGLAVDVEDNVIVTGNLTDLNYTAKYAGSEGTLIWRKNFDAPPIPFSDEGPTSVTTDRKGNIYVAGTLGQAYCTARYEATDGTVMWKSRQNGPANRNDSATGLALDLAGNVVVTGISEVENGATKSYTAKYAAADGLLLWSRESLAAGVGQWPATVAVDESGNVVTASGGYTAKYAAADGALLWEQRFRDYSAVRVALDRVGNAVVTGIVRVANRNEFHTIKYAASDGTLLWERSYNGVTNGWDEPAGLAIDSKNNVVVTGPSEGGFYTAKYSAAEGKLLWEKRYKRITNTHDEPRAVAVDGSDNVVVTGRLQISNSASSGDAYDFYTAKYAADNGALLWEKSYDGPKNGDDEASAVAVDSIGNVLVGGYSQGDLYMAKYAAADGALLWEKRQASVSPASVQVDNRNDFVVIGASWNSEGASDYYTAKFASADGALLWEKRYNGPADSNDSAYALAVGQDGRIAVTGVSSGNFSSSADDIFDFATVLYREGLSPVGIDRVPSGIRLSFTGDVGQTYSIQRASKVMGPWITLRTQVTPGSGLIQYDDSASAQKASFYRTTQP